MKNEALPREGTGDFGRCAREVFHQHSSPPAQTHEIHISRTVKSAVMMNSLLNVI